MPQLLDDDGFYKSLENIGLRPRNAVAAPLPRLNDAAYDRITNLLEFRGGVDWQRLTRTFTVLYQCSLEHLMSAFLKEKRTDYSLPYTKDSLPVALADEDRKRFLACQEQVLDSDGARIERGKSKHVHLNSSADKLFIFSDLLGRGGFGEVTKVTGKSTFQTFALKRVKRWHLDQFKDSKSLHFFRQELETLQSLKHRHIVNLVGSYTDDKYVGLLMKPVAEENLKELLERQLSAEKATERCRRLRGFFGCIATAIDYFHNNKTGQVLHKDVKPANILVQNVNVYIADFGAAALRLDSSTGVINDTTVCSTNRAYTLKYLAPEAAFATRTSASDIWSLGCVFLEMLTVLAGREIGNLKAFFENNGTRTTIYHKNRPAMDQWTENLHKDLLKSRKPEDAQLVGIVKLMCIHEPSKRIDARGVLRRIFALEGDTRYYGICCDVPSQPLAHGGQSTSTDGRPDAMDDSAAGEDDVTATMPGAWVDQGEPAQVIMRTSSSRCVAPVEGNAETVIPTTSKTTSKIQQDDHDEVTQILRRGTGKTTEPVNQDAAKTNVHPDTASPTPHGADRKAKSKQSPQPSNRETAHVSKTAEKGQTRLQQATNKFDSSLSPRQDPPLPSCNRPSGKQEGEYTAEIHFDEDVWDLVKEGGYAVREVYRAIREAWREGGKDEERKAVQALAAEHKKRPS